MAEYSCLWKLRLWKVREASVVAYVKVGQMINHKLCETGLDTHQEC